MESLGTERVLRGASSELNGVLALNGSLPTEVVKDSLHSIHLTMVNMLSRTLKVGQYHLASLDPGSGKTEAICAFLRAWKSEGFLPSGGAIIILRTLKEIRSCIERASLLPADFAILIQKGHEMNGMGSAVPDSAPVIFTTQEKLRRLCVGRSFAEVDCLHHLGQPRSLRIWDEAFLPAAPQTIRKDVMLQALADLRPVDAVTAESVESFSDSLGDDRTGEAVWVPSSVGSAHRVLSGRYGAPQAERWAPLRSMAGQPAIVVNGGSRGLCLAGGVMSLPDDFAPALILDASGRVRETYKTMEASGILKRLPSGAMDYSRLRIHHWNRAASRSTLEQPEARQEVLEAAAAVINGSGDKEPWLVIHAKDRPSAPASIVQDLAALIENPSRLSFLHWGNHHGTNDYRDIGKVMVLGLWNQPAYAYPALHLASGGSPDLATDKATLSALQAGEYRHDLLQAICRASVRQGADGVCGDCEVWLVDRLGNRGTGLLQETFPSVQVAQWKPLAPALKGTALRVAEALETALAAPGVRQVTKGALRATVGIKTDSGLWKVVRGEPFVAWRDSRGIRETVRAFEWMDAA